MHRELSESAINNKHDRVNEADLDFAAIFRSLWQRKVAIAVVATVFVTLGVIVAFVLPNKYTAQALVAPSQKESTGGLGGLVSQYAGVAALAGVRIGDGELGDTNLAIEILRSRRFAIDFIDRHDLLVPLMAADGWDSEVDELSIDPDIYDVSKKIWVREVEAPLTPQPTSLEAYRALSDIFSISESDSSGFYEIRVRHYSPSVAKQWVDWLIQDINAALLRRDLTQATSAIDYLEAQLETTSLSELRDVLFSLIAEQMKVIALAEASQEYIFETVDPAITPEIPSSPNRILIVLVAGFFGVGLGVAAALLLDQMLPFRGKNAAD